MVDDTLNKGFRWTKTRPAVCGWYFFRSPAGPIAEPVEGES